MFIEHRNGEAFCQAGRSRIIDMQLHEKFAGEEAVWHHGEPVWSMNYAGRVIGKHFSGDFLKEVLSHVPVEQPFRGPDIYTNGDYRYHCRTEGEFVWYQGYEEIFYMEERIYECYFHGGVIQT